MSPAPRHDTKPFSVRPARTTALVSALTASTLIWSAGSASALGPLETASTARVGSATATAKVTATSDPVRDAARAARDAQRAAARAAERAQKSASRAAAKAARKNGTTPSTPTKPPTTTPSSPETPQPPTTTPQTPTPPTTTPQTPTPPTAPAVCSAGAVPVSSASALTAALAAATPGTTIQLADGVYAGRFVLTAQGTAEQPITICGSSNAILDGGSTSGGYVFHLNGAAHVRLVGFTVRNGQKGVMADGVHHVTLQGLQVHTIGDEAIHLRRMSSDNIVRDCTVHTTGARRDKFGEGIYVGTAISNWPTITGGRPDTSDRNVIINNTVYGTTSEAVDVKEGTTGGLIAGNRFDGSATDAADSVVDVKGNDWLVRDNTITAAPLDALQTHQILAGWGDRNVFDRNIVTSTRQPGGWVVALTPKLSNVALCTNVAAPGMGVSKTGCR